MVHLQEKSGSVQLQVITSLLMNHPDITTWEWIPVLRLQPTCKYLLLIHYKLVGLWDCSRLVPELSNLNRPQNHHSSLTDQIWQDLIQAQIRTSIVSSVPQTTCPSWFSVPVYRTGRREDLLLQIYGVNTCNLLPFFLFLSFFCLLTLFWFGFFALVLSAGHKGRLFPCML